MFKKNFKKILKAIVRNLAIAFFFTCLCTTILYFVCLKDVDNYLSLFNSLTYTAPKNEEVEKIELDPVTKKIVNYPKYGDLYGTVELPTVDIKVNLYHGDSMEILKHGAGHYAGSYFPSEGGTTIIAAHNRREYFKYLPKLNVGDPIVLNTDYGKFTYSVTNGRVETISELEKVNIQHEEEVLVLYTCYPVDALGFTDKRYVVYAKLEGAEYES